MSLVGINTCVYMDELSSGVPQAELLPRIAELGLTLAEARREFIASDAEYDAIARAARDLGLTMFLSIPESLTLQGAPHPKLEQFLSEAERMGAVRVKFNQGDVKDVSARVLADIDAAGRAHGIALTIENDQTLENGTLACTKASLENIASKKSDIGYTFDVGNWCWRGEDPSEAFDQLLDRITVFHLKDVAGAAARAASIQVEAIDGAAAQAQQPRTTMLDGGDIDWRAMLARLDSDVPVLLEFPIPAGDVAGQVTLVRNAR
ncbi:MAG: sugar phosphate isomerase/epimerase [Actinomycetaceae bacterium]|nr:sugar phosphate isomerase/epimerase [Actinomycetaceae bacterium]MDU0970883.1 sugar phosphate isomerase/epimerase [Actinomycetaceae bacterium]